MNIIKNPVCFLHKFLLIAIFIIAPVLLHAQAIEINQDKESENLNEKVKIFIDKEGKKSFEEVSNLNFTSNFSHKYKDVPKGFTKDVYWVKFVIKNSENKKINRLIEIENSSFRDISFYEISENNKINLIKMGIYYPFAERTFKYRNPLYEISLSPNTGHTYYLKFVSTGGMHFPILLWKKNEYFYHLHCQTFVFGMYYGMILVVILYNLFLFYSFKDRSYLYYVLYISCFCLFQLSNNGFGYEFLWPTPFWLTNRITPLMVGLTGFWGSLFVINFQQVKRNNPIFFKILIGLAIAGCMVSIISLIDERTGIEISPIYGIVFVIVILTSIFACWKNNIRQAKYLLIAWSAFLIGVILLALYTMGFLPNSFLVDYSLQIGSALEAILLSLALGDRINTLRIAKENAEIESKQMEQSKKFKEQFLAHVSHEIRTPMNVIIGFSRLLSRTQLNNVQENHVYNIQHSADNLLIIINDILDVTKMESGRMQFEEIEIYVHSFCKSLIENIKILANEKHINLKYEIDNDVPEVVVGDRIRLNQILLNLINNAIKFTEVGFVGLRVTKSNEVIESNGIINLIFEISDTGIGISQHNLVSIFEGYTQARNDTTRKYGGTGLGLTIAKQLTELQGGTIDVESVENQGSIFKVKIPFKSSSKEKIENIKLKNDLSDIDLSTLNIPTAKILLIDDNPINQSLSIQTILEYNPHIKIDTAENGKIGIHKLLANDYDLILMDIQMPEMNGYQTCKYIREHLKEGKNKIPIIALTADVLIDNQNKIIEAGMNDFIYKPFKALELFQKMEKLNIKSLKPSAEKERFEVGHIRKNALGNAEFMLELMNMFTDKIPDVLLQMKIYTEEKDWINLSFISHKNKTIFVVMGLSELYEKLSEIEIYAKKAEKLDLLQDKVNNFIQNCEEVVKQVLIEKGRVVIR